MFPLRKTATRPAPRTFSIQLRHHRRSVARGGRRVDRALHRSSARVRFRREKDFVVRISDREFWIDFLREQKVPEERWQEMLADDRQERARAARKNRGANSARWPNQFSRFSTAEEEAKNSIGSSMASRHAAWPISSKIDLGIVRGLAYYTGVVFEAFDRGGKVARARRRRALRQFDRATERRRRFAAGAGFAMGDVVLGELIAEIPRRRESKMEAAVAAEQRTRYLRRHREGGAARRRAARRSRRSATGLSRRLSARAGQSRQTISNSRATGRAGRDPLRRRMAAGESKDPAPRAKKAHSVTRIS